MPEFMTFARWRRLNRDLEDKLLDAVHVSGVSMRELIDIDDANGGDYFEHEITTMMESTYNEQKIQDKLKLEAWNKITG